MPDPTPEDLGVRLMLAYQAGEEEAFDELVERYSPRVFALVTRFLGPRSGREDLVQEVFLRVVRARERYQPTARFSTWLYRITFNLCVNATQRADRALEEGELASRPDGPGWDAPDEGAEEPSAGLERDDVVRAVRTAIAALPESQRMALILAKYDELPYVEIARVLDSSEKAIKSLVHRARESLRATLAPYLQGDHA